MQLNFGELNANDNQTDQIDPGNQHKQPANSLFIDKASESRTDYQTDVFSQIKLIEDLNAGIFFDSGTH